VSETIAPDAVIDVYTDVIPEPHQRSRGMGPMVHDLVARPHPNGGSPHDFLTPKPDPPFIERPSVWDASCLPRDELLARIETFPPCAAPRVMKEHYVGAAIVLDWLAGFGGVSWQQRWRASGADEAGEAWMEAFATPGRQRQLVSKGAGELILVDAIRPSFNWLYQFRSAKFFLRFRALRDAEGFARLDPICERIDHLIELDRSLAYIQLARMLAHNGGALADITVEDCVESYRAQTGYSSRQHSLWYLLLLQAGILPAGSPPNISAASRKGQLSIAELVDGYRVECHPIRDLFIDYLHERQAGMDYTSVRSLTTMLVLQFWRDLEIHEPSIDSLRLPDEAARAWKQRLRTIRYGNHRVGELREDPNRILMAVRAFYADLAHWALEDPGRWGPWAAPNPISGRDLIGQNKAKPRARARMHQRIRELAPILPALVATAEMRKNSAHQLLAAARAGQPGAIFEATGEVLRRLVYQTDPAVGGRGRPGVIYATDPEGGPRRNLTLEEENAFWSWAIVEVLRHTGARIEEMLELTHRSLAAYTLPATGEVIPLLQITPSKTDRERLLVVSPELAEVLAEIIHRVRAGTTQLPLAIRYDGAERLHSPPLPFLFQRPWGLSNVCFTNTRVKELLDVTAASSGIAGPDGRPVRFTPHDFRRIFATEAVAAGLPVHIAAKLLGHQTLATTQAYVAVYDEQVIEHHRAFIARRRATRPSVEYREPTDTEWDEFLGHFEHRKVELGTCGRAYATACPHEHACIRCPVLRPDPAQTSRLSEIISNLAARITEAHQHGWLGEIEGLETSLAAARQKLAAMDRIAGLGPAPVVLRSAITTTKARSRKGGT
jgi:integrase